MPEEQIGFGPASMEHPETDSFATREESLAEVSPVSPEVPPQQAEGSGKYEKLLQNVAQVTAAANPTDDSDAKVDLAHIQTLEGEEEKIEHLVKLAQSKGLVHAVRVAEHLKDYYALDMFHDTIVNDLYDSLLKEGLITNE